MRLAYIRRAPRGLVPQPNLYWLKIFSIVGSSGMRRPHRPLNGSCRLLALQLNWFSYKNIYYSTSYRGFLLLVGSSSWLFLLFLYNNKYYLQMKFCLLVETFGLLDKYDNYFASQKPLTLTFLVKLFFLPPNVFYCTHISSSSPTHVFLYGLIWIPTRQ